MMLSLALALAVTTADPTAAAPKRVETNELVARTTVEELDTLYCVRTRRHTHTRTAPVCRPLWEWRAIKASAADHSATFFSAGDAVTTSGDFIRTKGAIVVSTALLEEAAIGRSRHLSIKRQKERAARKSEAEAARQLIEEVEKSSERR